MFHYGHPRIVSVKFFLGTNFKTCKTKNECIPLKDCRYYTNLIETAEKPLRPVFVEFLRAQQCGFQDSYPTVCCSLLPKTFKVSRDGSRKQNKLSSAELEIKDLFSANKTNSSRNRKSKKEAVSVKRKFDMADIFDLTVPFDLFRRRRSYNELEDTEI